MSKIKNVPLVQISRFLDKATTFATAGGNDIFKKFVDESNLLLEWIKHLQLHHLTGVANELLIATRSNIREAAAYAAVGAVRPCLFAMRAQPDLLLSWLYFKDHPVEYATLCRTGDNYMLKTEVLKYLAAHHEKFSSRLTVMNQTITRTQLDPYRLLSAHIHSQSPFVINEITDLEDIIRENQLSIECTKVQHEISEYLSDILFSIEFSNYHALPQAIKKNLEARVKTEGQRKVIYS